MARFAKVLVIGAVALAAAGTAAAAHAQAQPRTPKSWSYPLDKNGQRVPRAAASQTRTAAGVRN